MGTKLNNIQTTINTKANTADVYTKQESDNKYATKTELNTKANAADVYTKQETDNAISTAIDNIPDPDLSSYATKSYVDTTFATKSEVTTVSNTANGALTKAILVEKDLEDFETHANTTFATKTELNTKANAADVYTKQETDSAISTAISSIPDPDLSSYAKKYDRSQDITANSLRTWSNNTNWWVGMNSNNSQGGVIQYSWVNHWTVDAFHLRSGGIDVIQPLYATTLNTTVLTIGNDNNNPIISSITGTTSEAGQNTSLYTSGKVDEIVTMDFDHLQIGEIAKYHKTINYYQKITTNFPLRIYNSTSTSVVIIFMFLNSQINQLLLLRPSRHINADNNRTMFIISVPFTDISNFFLKYYYANSDKTLQNTNYLPFTGYDYFTETPINIYPNKLLVEPNKTLSVLLQWVTESSSSVTASPEDIFVRNLATSFTPSNFNGVIILPFVNLIGFQDNSPLNSDGTQISFVMFENVNTFNKVFYRTTTDAISNHYGLCLEFQGLAGAASLNNLSFTLKLSDDNSTVLWQASGTISNYLITWTDTNVFTLDYPYITTYLT